jgi:hypothetical protein
MGVMNTPQTETDERHRRTMSTASGSRPGMQRYGDCSNRRARVKLGMKNAAVAHHGRTALRGCGG